jgi:hypothetical protein
MLVIHPSPFEFQIATWKLKNYTSRGIDQIPTELIQVGGETLRSRTHKGFNYIWNKKELSDQCKESIIVPVHKKDDKTDCNNYRGISLLSISYKILSNILLSRLSPFIDEIFGAHQCGFRRDRSTIDKILCIRQILEKKWEYNETVHKLFVDFKKA